MSNSKERIYGKDEFGDAGEFPYTRGLHKEMYRKKLWTMRQYAGFGNAADANKRFKFLLSQGTTGLSIAFDLPTQMGRDPDHPVAAGEVGRVGVSISTVKDMEQLLADIPLDEVSISMTINATATILLALLCVKAKRESIPLSKLRGTTQNDILKEYIARGTYIYPPDAGLKLSTDLIEFCKDALPQWNTTSISGYHIREAGCTAAQEIAFTFANGLTYIDHALSRGLSIDAFAPRLSFFFNCHRNFFEELAKFRAARTLWALLIQERYSPKNPQSLQLRFHTQTAGSSLTAQQPENNTVRTTLQALAAVLGGTQSLHTNGFDEALHLPTPQAAALALRTQQIIAYETSIAAVVDPLGGAPYIEHLTDSLQSEAQQIMRRIDDVGGMVRAIAQHLPQSEIEKAAYAFQRSVEEGTELIVGVNCFNQIEENEKVPAANPLPTADLSTYQRDKSGRDLAQVENALELLRTVAIEDRNTLPGTIAALEQGATLGEISDVFRQVFGEYHE